ncbi:hypothetical protein J4465_03000 [Candidatus Pacearchaeota archaeon]|nr:hypothetical protein [Candidatus Pacearchaeota archaeon]
MYKFTPIFLFLLVISLFFIGGCNQDSQENLNKQLVETSRYDQIPIEVIKMTPENDQLPPILHSDEYSQPVPLPYPVNTRGAEDSSFIMPDGNTLYVWFTPDPNIDVTKQVIDGVTGIYEFKKQENGWGEAKRVWLVEPGKPNLDGCGFFQDNRVWICGAREGYTGMHWFTSEFKDGKWGVAKIADFESSLEVGELDIYGNELYYHSSRAGGKGQYDVWVSEKINGEWQTPTNIDVVNTEETEGWPQRIDNELWFTRIYLGSPAIFRSKLVNGEWQEPELILSQFAGESTIDSQGNIYFTHHFYKDNKMLEADIYVAYKK